MPDPDPVIERAPLTYHRPIVRPWWVRLGLVGIPSRTAAWSWLIFSIIAAILMALSWSRWWFLLFLATLWYYLAIRWVDHHDSWS